MENNTNNTQFNDLIESKVGMSIEEIRRQPYDSVVRHIERSASRPLTLSDSKPTLSYRGNMLLAVGKIVRDIDGLFNRTFGIR